jgi:Rieske Fe-S protein
MKHPIVLSVLVLAGAVIVAVVVTSSMDEDPVSTGLGTLSIPAIGTTEAGSLDDDSPVFISTNLDGSVSVVGAVSTHLPDDPMGWCDISRTIEDLLHGGRFNSKGQYLTGPGRTDLGTYAFSIDDSGEHIIVLGYIAPTERSADIQPDNPITQWRESESDYLIHPPYLGQ